MIVTQLQLYRGPSHLSRWPVIVWRLDGPAPDAGMVEAGWTAFRRDFPGVGRPPVPDDADPALGVTHLVAIWARELLNSANGLIEAAGATSRPSESPIGWCGFHETQVTREALRLACGLVARAGGAKLDDGALEQLAEAFRARAARRHLNRSGLPMGKAARARDIPFAPSYIKSALWCYGWGRAGRTLVETSSFEDSFLGHWIARSKSLGRQFLFGLGFPVTEQALAATADEAVAVAARMTGPVVIKPEDRGKGRGVTVGIHREDDIRRAFAEASEWTDRPLVVERFVPGHDHRLLVVGGVLVAAARREPATVVGDGRHSVGELVEAINAGRAADPILDRYLHRVVIDDVALDHLQRQGSDLDTVPARGIALSLRGNANISTGGASTDVLDRVHPDVRAMAEAVARNSGVHALGIDYITTDIARSWQGTGGAIIEINCSPGVDVHIASGIGEEEIGSAILGPDIGRIPVAVVIAPAADQHTLLDHLQAAVDAWAPRWNCGIVADAVLRVGATALAPVAQGDHARTWQVLQNRDCDAAVLCLTARSMLDVGFPVDRCELSVIRGGQHDMKSTLSLAQVCSNSTIVLSADAAWEESTALAALLDIVAPGDGRA